MLKSELSRTVLKKAHIPYILACHLQSDVDPDQAYPFDVDPDPDFYLMRMWIHTDPDPDPTIFALPRVFSIIIERTQGVWGERGLQSST